MAKNKSKKQSQEGVNESHPIEFTVGEASQDCKVKAYVAQTKKVRAIERGFYGNQRRRVGEEFDVPVDAIASWFQDAELPMPDKERAMLMRGQSPASVVTREHANIKKEKFAQGHAPEIPHEAVTGGN